MFFSSVPSEKNLRKLSLTYKKILVVLTEEKMQYRLEIVRPENVQAGQKSDYTMREGKYATRRKNQEDLVYKSSGNIPAWANSPREFWQTAEQICAGTSKNIYFEMRLSLQEELSPEQNIEVVESFLQRTGIKDNHVYSYAIHDKIAAFDKEHRNIHAHIMINEKIIEKDRPLEPELFFKRYSKNKAGEIVGGYRSTKAFQKGNIDNIRQIWEQCINEKFDELGYNLKVDSRTLKAQKEELLAQGKTEDAKLLDREPGIHLGPKFQNPKLLEKILKTIEYIKKNKDYQVLVEPDENASWVDKQIYLFAKDYTLRMAAKEILRQRQNELKAAQQAEENRELSFDLNEPFVITAKQLRDEIIRRNIEHQAESKKYESIIVGLQKKIIPAERLDFAAKDLFCEGEFKKAMANYRRIALEYKEKNNEILLAIKQQQQGKPYPGLTELQQLTNQLYKDRNTWGEKLNALKKKIETNAPQIEAIKTKLSQESADAIRRKNKYKIELEKKSQVIALEQKKLEELIRLLPEETVIFTHKLPPTLILKHKLFGIKPLTELKLLRLNQNQQTDGQYLLLDGTDKLNNNGEKIQKAVKLYSDLTKGRATVFEINLNNKSVTETDELIPIYKVKDRMQLPKTEKQQIQKTNIPVVAPQVTKIVQNLADKLMASNLPPTQISWMPDDDQDYIINGKIDEAKLADKMLSP